MDLARYSESTKEVTANVTSSGVKIEIAEEQKTKQDNRENFQTLNYGLYNMLGTHKYVSGILK